MKEQKAVLGKVLQENMVIQVMFKELKCPKCGNTESHPTLRNEEFGLPYVLIRGFKVQDETGYWWSQCLVCAGAYDAELNPTPGSYNREKGWF